MYSVKKLFDQHGQQLGLELVAGEEGIKRKIKVPEVHRPGVSLTGYLKSHARKRILIFGRVEMEYLGDLESKVRIERLEALLTTETPAIIVTRRYRPPAELKKIVR